MLQRDHRFRTQVQQAADVCLFAIAFGISFLLRGNERFSHTFLGMEAVSGDTLYHVMWLYLAIFPFVPSILASQGFYSRSLTGSRPVMMWSLMRGCLIVTIGLVLLIYLLKIVVPRGVMTLFGLISFGLVYTKEETLRWVLNSRLARSQYQRRILLAGMPSEMKRLRQLLETRASESIQVAAEFNLESDSPAHLIEMLHEYSVSGVLVSARKIQLDRLENVIQLCEIEGVEAWLVADFFTTQIARASFDEMLGQPLLIFRSAPENSWQILVKGLMDWIVAATLLLVLTIIPVLPVLAVAIKITSPGPVLFRQQRSGRNGAPFTILKFRTMSSNAEQSKHELAAMNEMTGPVFKLTNDPRITPLGKWLRKYSLDELPQLWNVLRGDMSLVGPRPLPVDEVRRFNDLAHRRRLSVKPGLTCLWQVSGRNQIKDFKDWVRMDLEYIDNWSIWLDLLILLRTLPAVLGATGAR